MPTIQCPRCSSQLREQDCCVYEGLHWLRNTMTVQVECWNCTWSTSWQAANVTEEKAEEVKL